MFRLHILTQTIELALLPEGIMKAILKEVKDSNDSDGEAICEAKNDIREDDLVVSINAIFDSTSHQIMRIGGNIKKKYVTILFDSRSTHIFLDPIVAKRTGCSMQTTNPMKVAMADGIRSTSYASCRQLTWNMQRKEFQANLRLLSLGGCNMVLRIRWLAKLGSILWDFKNLRMKFIINGKKFMLKGEAIGPTKLVRSQAFTNRILFIQWE